MVLAIAVAPTGWDNSSLEHTFSECATSEVLVAGGIAETDPTVEDEVELSNKAPCGLSLRSVRPQAPADVFESALRSPGRQALAAVIGKGGANIQEIEQSSGVTASV